MSILSSRMQTHKTNQQNFSEGGEVLSQLISVGILDIHAHYDQLGSTLLHQAVEQQKYLLVQSLLQNGADVNAKDVEGLTPLGVAIYEFLPDMVKILLNHQADLGVSQNRRSALWLALTIHPRNQSEEIKQTLILDLIFQHGMKSKDILLANYFKLCRAIVNNDLRATKRLINHCEDVNFTSLNVKRPIEYAVHLDRIEVVRLFLKKDEVHRDRQSLLVQAIKEKRLDIVKLLLMFKINLNFFFGTHCPEIINTPLYQAMTLRDIELMKMFLDHGAEAKGVSHHIGNYHQTTLHGACEIGFFEGVELLLKNGAEVHAKDSNGATPLHSACNESVNIKLINLLLKYGANVAAVDYAGKMILHHMDYSTDLPGVECAISLAFENGININTRRNDGHTALHDKSCDVLLGFLRNGADLNIQSNRGAYPDHDHSYIEDDDFECAAFEYVRRLQYLGYELKHPFFRQSRGAKNSTENYQLELDEMKKWVIAWNPKTTLRDVLFMSRRTLDRFSANKNLKEAFEECSNDFESKFPYFGSVLNVLCRRVMYRKKYFDAAKNNLDKIFDKEMPSVCIGMILKYLVDDSLKKFTDSNL